MKKYTDLCSPAAESGIIATLLNNPQFIFNSEELHPRDFADTTNACLYWGISELAHDGVTSVDDYQLFTILSSNKAVENRIKAVELKDIQSILALSEYACRHTAEEYQALVKDVQEFKSKRELYISAQKLQDACLSGELNSDELQSLVYNMADTHSIMSNRNKPVEVFGAKVDRLWEEQVMRQQGLIKSVPMHIQILNEFTSLEAGELVLIGAPPKAGKSAFLLSAALDLLKRDMTVHYIDSELDDRIMLLRMIANLTRIPFKTVKDGTGTPEQNEHIEQAKDWIKSKSFYHTYLPAFSESELMATFRRVNCIQKTDCLIVDYIKLVEAENSFDSSLKLAAIVNTAKNGIAGEYSIPVLGAVQTTDSGAVALSRGVIRYCSTLFTLRRKTSDQFIADGGAAYGNTYCKCEVNRNGRQMNSDGEMVSIQFDGDFCLYRDADQQPPRFEPY